MFSKKILEKVIIKNLVRSVRQDFFVCSIHHWGGESRSVNERVHLVSEFFDFARLDTITENPANVWIATVEVSFLVDTIKAAFAKKDQELELRLDLDSNFNVFLGPTYNPKRFESKWDCIILANLRFVHGKFHARLFQELSRSLRTGGRLILISPCISSEEQVHYNYLCNYINGTLVVESDHYQLIRTPEEIESFLRKSNFSEVISGSCFSSILEVGSFTALNDYLFIWDKYAKIPARIRQRINLRFHEWPRHNLGSLGCFYMDMPAMIFTAIK